MEAGYVDFSVNMGAWKKNHRATVTRDFTTLHEAMAIAHATAGADIVLEDALRSIVELNKLDEVIQEATRGKAGDALTLLASRKTSTLITQLSEGGKRQAKEKKELQEMMRLYASRKVLRHYKMELNYGLAASPLAPSAWKEGSIQFIANYDAWKCVKKFRVEPHTNRTTLAEFITSYTITLDLRFHSYLQNLVSLSVLDAVLKKSPGKAGTYTHLIDFLHSSEVTQTIQKMAAMAKADAAECEAILRAYAARTVLKERGLLVEFIQIKSLPGWKRVVGKRK